MFRALLLEKDDSGQASARLTDLQDSDLPPGEVTVAVEYSTLNYKDGLCLSPTGGGLVRNCIIWSNSASLDPNNSDGGSGVWTNCCTTPAMRVRGMRSGKSWRQK